VISAILEDIPLGANDEIAIFSGQLCVGAKTLVNTIDVNNNSTFLTIEVSQNDGSGNGFSDNDTILFKIWDSKNQKEMIAKSVKYRNDLATWITNGRFSQGSTAVVEIASYVEYTQSIPLIKGANLYSSYVLPANPDVKTNMEPLCDQSALINMADELGNTFEYNASLGGWTNKIGSLSKTEGYSISLNFNSTLTITGRPIALPLDIPLKLGWNYISFPRMDAVSGLSVVQPLINQKKLIKVQDERGYTIEKVKNAWKNNIGNFIPGKAYKINVGSACTLTIQQSYLKSADTQIQVGQTDNFSKVYEGNGLDHMNINLTGLNESGMFIGDEIAAYDGTICVGAVKLNKDHFTDGSVSLIASSSSGSGKHDGFIEGHSIQIYKWDKTTGIKSTIEAENIAGELNFEKLASIEINLKSSYTTVSELKNENNFDIFPNPGNDVITVRFSKMPEVGREIVITDVLGKKIISRAVIAIQEEFNLKAQPAGLYFVKSVYGNDYSIQKLILN
jgi:hypothetical protein